MRRRCALWSMNSCKALNLSWTVASFDVHNGLSRRATTSWTTDCCRRSWNAFNTHKRPSPRDDFASPLRSSWSSSRQTDSACRRPIVCLYFLMVRTTRSRHTQCRSRLEKTSEKGRNLAGCANPERSYPSSCLRRAEITKL